MEDFTEFFGPCFFTSCDKKLFNDHDTRFLQKVRRWKRYSFYKLLSLWISEAEKKILHLKVHLKLRKSENEWFPNYHICSLSAWNADLMVVVKKRVNFY